MIFPISGKFSRAGRGKQYLISGILVMAKVMGIYHLQKRDENEVLVVFSGVRKLKPVMTDSES